MGSPLLSEIAISKSPSLLLNGAKAEVLRLGHHNAPVQEPLGEEIAVTQYPVNVYEKTFMKISRILPFHWAC